MIIPLVKFLESLPKGELSKDDLLTKTTLMDCEGDVAVHYIPFDYFPEKVDILLVGITPGFTQMRLAYEAARDHLAKNNDESTLHRVAKQAASFGGPMRRILCNMLDEAGLPKALSVNHSAEIFEDDYDAVAFTSVLRCPVFVAGENYTGHRPKLVQSEFLMGNVREYFVRAVEPYPDALIVPMGKAVEEVLRFLDLPNPVLWGFPHPSPANGHRKRQLEANKSGMQRIIREWRV